MTDLLKGPSKQKKIEKVAEHVLKIISVHGLGGVTYSKVARAADVSRSWLYKYIGSEKEDLVAFAVLHFGKIFSRMDIQVGRMSPKQFVKHAVDSLDHVFMMPQAYPWLLPIYFRYFGTKTPIGECIADLEKKYLDRVEYEIKHYLKPKPEFNPRSIAQFAASMNMAVSHRFQMETKAGNHSAAQAEIEQYKRFTELLFSNVALKCE